MRTIGIALIVLTAGTAAAVAVACDNETNNNASSSGASSGTSGTTTSSGGTTSGSPTNDSGPSALTITTTEADKPAITPCPSKDLLTDAAKIGALKTAMSTGAISYLDLPYNASDPDILKKKCGLEGFWNPTDNVDPIPVTGAPKLSTVLTTGNGGICATGFTSFGTDDGFPAAGVYRKEFKAVANAATYHVRARITTSGTAAGQKFSALSITVPGDIQTKLVYEVNGVAAPHDNVWTAIVDAMTAPAPSVTMTTKNGGTAIFTSKIELICAAQN